jgi:tetratricopeptide (TPR) repeat protein
MPLSLSELNKEELFRSLRQEGIDSEVVDCLYKNDIDGKLLVQLSDSELEKLNITKLGQKKKIEILIKTQSRNSFQATNHVENTLPLLMNEKKIDMREIEMGTRELFKIAPKVYKATYMGESYSAKRLFSVTEQKTLAMFLADHPRISKLLFWSESDNQTFILSDLMEENLHHSIFDQNRKFSVLQKQVMVRDLISALYYLFSKKYYLSIKLDKCLVDRDLHVKLNLACILEDSNFGTEDLLLTSLESILYQIIYEKESNNDRQNSVSIRSTHPNLCLLESLRLLCLNSNAKPNLRMISNLFSFELKIQEIFKYRTVAPRKVLELCENETSWIMKAFWAEAQVNLNNPLGKVAFEEILKRKPSFQGDLIARGITLYKAASYKEAIECFSKELPNHIAQLFIGECHYRIKNYAEAFKFYKLSADQGNSCAQNNLGYCFVRGEGCSKNYGDAFVYQRLCAENGNSAGQNELGVLYFNGFGCTKNESEAIRWYTLSAEQGNHWGQNNIGVCYFHGFGVPKDYKEAFKWFQRSADQGNASSSENLKKLKQLDKDL